MDRVTKVVFTCRDDREDAGLCLYTETVDSPAEETAVVHLSDGDVLCHGVGLVSEHGVRGDVPELGGGVELPPVGNKDNIKERVTFNPAIFDDYVLVK